MTENVFNEVFKIYKRFLKDNGVYNRVLELHSTHNKKELKRESISSVIYNLLIQPTPLNYISNTNLFCTWFGTKEGEFFWWTINVKWKIKCLLENIGCERYGIDSCQRVLNVINTYLEDYKSKLNQEEIDYINNSIDKIKKI